MQGLSTAANVSQSNLPSFNSDHTKQTWKNKVKKERTPMPANSKAYRSHLCLTTSWSISAKTWEERERIRKKLSIIIMIVKNQNYCCLKKCKTCQTYSNDFREDDSECRLHGSIDDGTKDSNHYIQPFGFIQFQDRQKGDTWNFLQRNWKV